MKAEVRQVNGLVMIGKSDSNHWVVMDGPKALKGREAGSTPMELVLIALGGCLAMDIVSLLEKKRTSLDNVEIHLKAQQNNNHPRIFNKIEVKCIFYGKELREKDIKWAIEKSRDKYCSVGAMLAEVAEINYSWEVK